MTTQVGDERRFTGRHMLLIMLAFFGVVISVNVVMATFASKSWTGLVVENTYVASQEFNEKAQKGRDQAALGWRSNLSIGKGQVRFGLTDASGAPVHMSGVKVLFRHPAYESHDEATVLTRDGDDFWISHTPKDGIWIVEVDADAGLARPYRVVRRLIVRNGAVQ